LLSLHNFFHILNFSVGLATSRPVLAYNMTVTKATQTSNKEIRRSPYQTFITCKRWQHRWYNTRTILYGDPHNVNHAPSRPIVQLHNCA